VQRAKVERVNHGDAEARGQIKNHRLKIQDSENSFSQCLCALVVMPGRLKSKANGNMQMAKGKSEKREPQKHRRIRKHLEIQANSRLKV
jgi:hypothetical protein